MTAAEYRLAVDDFGVPTLPPVFLRAGRDQTSPIDLETARRLRAYRDHHAIKPTMSRPWRQVAVGTAEVDCLTYEQAVGAVCELARIDQHREMVVTPNIQHIAELRRGGEFAAAYAAAALVLPDGAPVVMTLRALTGRKQSRVTGADLVPGICRAAAAKGLTVGILGGQPGAAEQSAWRLQAEFPGLEIVLVEPAPWGFDKQQATLGPVLDHVAHRNPDILFIGLGAPKSEVFVYRHRDRLGTGVVLSVGAAIDFAAGLAVRAPVSWQRVGCEWLWRVVHEPRRLAMRYLKATPLFVISVLPSMLALLLTRSGWGRIGRRLLGRSAQTRA